MGGIDAALSRLDSALMAATPVGTSLTPYRGEDRRRVAGPVQSPYGRPFLLAALLVVLTWVALTFVVDFTPGWA